MNTGATPAPQEMELIEAAQRGEPLTRITINEALMLKRRLHAPFVSLDDIPEPTSADDSTPWRDANASIDGAASSDLRQLLEQAFDRLPDDFRTVFMLRAVKQLSTAETAECLDMNVAAVKTRFHRARARLRADITRRIRREQLALFEFAGERCDRIVAHVLARLTGGAQRPVSNWVLALVALVAMLPAPGVVVADDRLSDAADFRSDLNALRAGTVNLNDPAVTVELLRLHAVVGVTGFFDGRRLKSVGIQCALRHSDVDDSFAPGIGRRLDGWAARDLNIGAIIALAPNLRPFSDLLGVDQATVRTALRAWGPGKFDAELALDGKAFRDAA